MQQTTRIQKQIEDAQKLVSQANTTNTDEGKQPEATRTGLDNGNTDVIPNSEQEQTPQQETPQPVNETAFQDATSIDWKKRAETAEHRYNVLQGKYNKEITEARNPETNNQEVIQLKEQVTQLQKSLADLQQAPVEAPAPQPQSAQPDLSSLREDYGDELIDGLMGAMEAKANASVQQVQQSVNNVQQDSFSTKKALLSQSLAPHRINFEQVNNDPLFHDWLSKFDVDSGVQRQAKLQDGFNKGDLNTVSSMFIEFVNGGNTQPKQSVDFGEHVQQPTTAPVQQATPNQAQAFYSPQMIREFYSNKRKGRYSVDEAKRIEREIFQSMKNR